MTLASAIKINWVNPNRNRNRNPNPNPNPNPELSDKIVYSPVLKALQLSVHAPNHAICKYGVKNNYIFGIPNPKLPIHYTIFMGLLTMTIKGCLHVSIALGGFRSKNSLKSKIGPKNSSFREKGGLNFRFWFCYTEKAHPLAVSDWKNPPKNEHNSRANLGCGKSHMR